jgi:hypothetical protein
MLCFDPIFEYNIANTVKPKVSHYLIFNFPFSKTLEPKYMLSYLEKKKTLPILDYAQSKKSFSAGKGKSEQ